MGVDFESGDGHVVGAGEVEGEAGFDLDVEEVGTDVHGDGFAGVDLAEADPLGCHAGDPAVVDSPVDSHGVGDDDAVFGGGSGRLAAWRADWSGRCRAGCVGVCSRLVP